MPTTKNIISAQLFILALFFLQLEVRAQTFVPDDKESQVVFKIRNFGATVAGTFKGLKGNIHFDTTVVSNSKFDVTLDAKTVDTGIGMRDNHLRKKEYFGVDEFPRIRFLSTKVVSTKAGQGLITGLLTIKNITKEIRFPFTYAVKSGRPEFHAEFRLNRRDFSVGGGSISLSDEVTLILNVKTMAKLE
ncbi:MAG: YceI family protein [Bacteroidota bacterium]